MADELWRVWCTSRWPIAHEVQRDDYGHAPDHPEYQLDLRGDYTSHLPLEVQFMAAVQKLASAWNMKPSEVLDMGLAEFHEQAMVHKAITLRKPKFEGWRGALEYKRFIIESKGKWKSPQGPWITEAEINMRPR